MKPGRIRCSPKSSTGRAGWAARSASAGPVLGDQAVLQAQRAVAVMADRLRSRHGGIGLEVQDLSQDQPFGHLPYLSVIGPGPS
jgi:hypothetical protein